MGIGSTVVGTTFAYAFHNTSIQLPLLSAASDGYLVAFNRSLTRWADSSDAVGAWSLPLTQSYDIVSADYAVHVTVHSALSAYFRAPVVVEDSNDGRLRLFSDFRACNNDVRVTVRRRGKNGSADAFIYDGPAAMNAAEYAYEAALNTGVADAVRALTPHQR